MYVSNTTTTPSPRSPLRSSKTRLRIPNRAPPPYRSPSLFTKLLFLLLLFLSKWHNLVAVQKQKEPKSSYSIEVVFETLLLPIFFLSRSLSLSFSLCFFGPSLFHSMSSFSLSLSSLSLSHSLHHVLSLSSADQVQSCLRGLRSEVLLFSSLF